MAGQKTKLKYLGKKGYDFRFEEIDSGEEVVLKIWKDKPFINDLVVNGIGYGLVNENWLNSWDKFDAQEPVQTINSYTEPTPTPAVNKKPMNGAREGMLINNAVQIAIAEFNKNDSKQIDINRVTGVYKALKTIFPEE